MGYIKEIQLDEKKLEALKRLYSSSDFDILNDVAEDLIQSLAYDVLARGEPDDGSSELEDEVRDARGGYHFWKRLKNIMERSSDKLADKKKET